MSRGGKITFLNVGHTLANARIYGPGVRFAIWLQGCTLGCSGCWNQQFWPTEGGELTTVEDMVAEIKKADVEGITLLGGEPLQQAESVLALIRRVKSEGLSVFLYTGYEKKEFTPTMKECVALSDIVISGRYVEQKRNPHLRWRGSSNQKIEFPSDRYASLPINEIREVEVHISDGNAMIYGYPNEDEKIK